MKLLKTALPAALAATAFALPLGAFAQSDATQDVPPTPAGVTSDQMSDQSSGLQTAEVTGSVRRHTAGVLQLTSGQNIYLTPDMVIKTDPRTLAFIWTRPIHVTGYVNELDGSIEATEIEPG